MVNTQQIEMSAITSVQWLLNNTGYIDVSDIRSGDKMPIWDGNIFVYNNKERRKNSTFTAKIPVQVKGITKSTFNSFPSYSIPRDNLISYRNDGGCLYFVVFVDANQPEKNVVYYKELLPYTINEILRGKQNIQTFSIHFKRMPSTPNQCLIIIRNFIEDQKKQRAYIQNLNEYSMDDFKQLTCSYISNSPEELIGQEITLYGIKDDLLYPCALGKVLDIKATIPRKVYLDDELWFDGFEISKSHPQSMVIINKNIQLVYENNRPKNFTINFDGEVSSIVKSLKFILALQKRPLVRLGDVTGYLDFEQEPYSKLKNFLKKYELLEVALKKANIFKDIELKNVSEKDEQNISILIATMCFDKEVSLNTNALCTILNISICNQSLVFIAIRRVDGKYNLKSFSEKEQAACEHNGEKMPISPYIILKAIHLKNVANINLEEIYTSITSYTINETYLDLVNDFILEVLIAYDETLEINLLKLADNLIRWLCVNANSHSQTLTIYRLNHIQIKRRQNVNLGEDDLEFLHKIIETGEQNDLKYGAYTLLGDKFGAQQAFNKMSIDNQNFMKTKPIYALFLKL